MASKTEKKEGWLKLENARVSHLFQTNGRSLCGRWAYFGLDRFDEPGPSPCKECLRRQARRRAAATEE